MGAPEQQTAAPDGLKEAVVERTTSDNGVWTQTWTWVEDHWLDLMAGAPAIVATLVLVDVLKPFLKLWLARKLGDSYTETIENAVVRLLAFPCAFIWCATLNFTSSFNAMTGAKLAWWQGMLLGTTLTAGAAMFLVWLKFAETLRVRFQRLTGVSKEDIEDAKTAKGRDELPEGRVTEEDVRKHLEEKDKQ